MMDLAAKEFGYESENWNNGAFTFSLLVKRVSELREYVIKIVGSLTMVNNIRQALPPTRKRILCLARHFFTPSMAGL
jgi:hypothetical protein